MWYVLGIDPGSEKSAYCLVRAENMFPVEFGKVDNDDLSDYLKGTFLWVKKLDVAIEQVASYGMPVGREVFQTCEWIGRFKQIAIDNHAGVQDVLRKEVCVELCHSAKAGDSNVRRALIDLYAKHDLQNGKGTKKNPDWFHGFAADVWSSYAIAHTFINRSRNQIK